MMASYKDRISLDYLRAGSSSAPQQSTSEQKSQRPPGIEEALLTYGNKILRYLDNQPNKSARIFDLAQGLKLRIDTVLPVIHFMVERGFIERTATDEAGNDTVRLSESGRVAAS
jgi:hypothetical protein